MSDVNLPFKDQRRVLVVDDEPAIHEDFRQILCGDASTELGAAKSALLGKAGSSSQNMRVVMESAEQGLDAVELVRRACTDKDPYLLAFVDVRLPPGIDGIETIERIWKVDPSLHVVICTAFSDYTWEQTVEKLGRNDHLLILKKPFEVTVVRQLTTALLAKAELGQQVMRQVDQLARETICNRTIIDTCNDAYLQLDHSGNVGDWSTHAEALFGWSREAAIGIDVDQLLAFDSNPHGSFSAWLGQQSTGQRIEMIARHQAGRELPVEVSIAPMRLEGSLVFNAFVHDIRRRQQLQAQLTHAQKMESVGRLAAGIAHEINTPTQYVSDNIRFLGDAFSDVVPTLEAFEALLQAAEQGKVEQQTISDCRAAADKLDWEFLVQEIPSAVEQAVAGVDRVGSIVSAMKQFSHPGQREMIPTDIREAIENTITISRNAWKYVAEIETDFDSALPPITCHPADLSQVFLNLIVNAADAIREGVGDGTKQRGRITISTRLADGMAEIRFADTGNGIAKGNRARVYDAFFTTKAVGVGTGQGLSIAHSVIVDGHQGSIEFETEVGRGTTFILRLPISRDGPDAVAVEQETLVLTD